MASLTSSTSDDKQKHTTAPGISGEAERSGKSSDTAEEDMPAEGGVENQINEQHLRRIERMFREADTDGGGGLDMAQFRDAMKKIMGDVDDEDVDIIFMKVDTNCDGRMDWVEYLNYMLLEYREKDSLQQQNRPIYFPKPLKIVPVAHCETIVRLQFYPFQPPAGEKKTDSGEHGRASGGSKGRAHSGRYLSISRDGVLNYWSERFKLLRTVNISQMQHTVAQPVWVTDMACLSNINQLSISSTGRDVEFYDISASKCDIVFSLSELEANVEVMDYWTDGKRGVYSIGDASGTIYIFVSSDVVHNGLFNSAAFKTGTNYRIPVSALLKNTSSSFLCFRVPSHNDWIHQIRYIPELNAIATCCAADQTSMILTTLPHSRKCKIQTANFHMQKGILCFDYSPELNVLVTGCFDRVVRVWNPYVTNQATSQMKGHCTIITHIAVNGRDNKIISVSKDKNVRVWDLQDSVCLQNIQSRNVNMGCFPITSTYYNHTSNTMVMATYLIGVLRGSMEDANCSVPTATTSHEQPLCAALYNSNFKQVVSGCHAGVVSVWDILTGEKVMQFQTTPERPVEVTAMTFDGPKRRLITGSKDGTLRLWNFNNGALLSELPLVDSNEVTGILYINERIYVSGWSKRVMWYLDNKEEDKMEHRVWNQYHSDDIYSMHAHGSKMLVTASYSGDVIVWNIDSGQAFCRFNASESPLPLLPIRVIEKPGQVVTVMSPDGLGKEDEDDVWLRSMVEFLETVSQTLNPQARRPSCANPAHTNVIQQINQARRCSIPEPPPDPVIQGPRANMRHGRRGSISAPVSALLPQPVTVSMGRRTTLLPRRKSKTINLDELEKPRFAVEKVLFLATRERSPDTAILLTSSADGYIYAWSIGRNGGLLGKFRAVHNKGPVICAMFTDRQDQILLTGDSNGYITLWDIEKYCYRMRGGGAEEESSNEDSLRLPQLIPPYCKVEGPRRLVVEQDKEILQGWSVSLIPPRPLSSWRCHLKGIVHLEYVERFRLIVTASLDCNVRLWTTAGRYIGTFGQGLWRVGDPKALHTELPVDLKRMGSCQTLKVLNEGKYPHWSCAKRILEGLTAQKSQQSTKFGGVTTQLRELVPTDPRIVKYTDEQIENTWRLWQEKGRQTSSILGRAYKQKVRHHLPSCTPDLQTTFSSQEQLRVYKALPYSVLRPVTLPPVPELLKDHQHRLNEGTDTAAKQKRSTKRRPHSHTRYLAAPP
ncbi:WD repeat-containing protein on Y chromosome [Oncorhynchus mykiss]|nr:WD repeat-containing protein on Y chromosome [Oncorhynchus mykiss]